MTDTKKTIEDDTDKQEAGGIHFNPCLFSMARCAAAEADDSVSSQKADKILSSYASTVVQEGVVNACISSKGFLDHLRRKMLIDVAKGLSPEFTIDAVDRVRRKQLARAFMSAYDSVNASTDGGIGPWQKLFSAGNRTGEMKDALVAIMSVLERDHEFCPQCAEQLLVEIMTIQKFLTE